MTPEDALFSLFAYCRAEGWAGHDPYDALNSPLLDPDSAHAPKLVRLVATQLLKRSPVDLRGLLRVPRTQNAKALALNIQSVFALEESNLIDTHGLVPYFVGQLETLRAKDQKYWCWGYSFPWQTRTVCVPRGAPNLVCTTFVADALMAAFERSAEPRLLEMASSAARYIANDLYYEGATGASFSYPSPGLSSTVHNANLLAAALLLRVNAHAPDPAAVERALRAARFSVRAQRPDGSWPYGEGAKQGWIDNFHTGFNLSALRSLHDFTGAAEFQDASARGHEFWRRHFIRDDGAARYFHDRTYPIDAHCVAQTILTLLEFRDRDPDALAAAERVCDFALLHLWDRRGFFAYRKLRFARIGTSYMRWTQAWMLLALATLVAHRRRI